MSGNVDAITLTTDPNSGSKGRLENKIAIVTGAASGIGRAIAQAYSREGAKVVVADLRDSSWNPKENDYDTPTHKLLEKNGGESIFTKVDTTSSASVEELVKSTVEKYGRLDIMVNCAGIAPEAQNPAPIWELKDETFNKTLAVNGNGVLYGTRAASAQMIKQEPHPSGDRGWIINLGSIFGFLAAPGSISYASSKHLCLGITKGAALDCAPYRIHVNAICPGYIRSYLTNDFIEKMPEMAQMAEAMHPFGGFGKPDDVGGVAVFLASEDAKWVTGSSLVVDGGFSIQ